MSDAIASLSHLDPSCATLQKWDTSPDGNNSLKRFAKLERRLQVCEGTIGSPPHGFDVPNPDDTINANANTNTNNTAGLARLHAANAISNLNASLPPSPPDGLPNSSYSEGLSTSTGSAIHNNYSSSTKGHNNHNHNQNQNHNHNHNNDIAQSGRHIAGGAAARRQTRKSLADPTSSVAKSLAAYAAAAEERSRYV